MNVGESNTLVIIVSTHEFSRYLILVSGAFLRTNLERKGDRTKIMCGGAVSQK